MTYDKKSVHFGGGAIGRGFVGEFLHNSGYEIVFVDVTDATVDLFNESDHYTITEVGADGEHQLEIDHFRAINSRTDPDQVVREIATADTVTCAVGPNILKFIAPLVAKGINARSPEMKPVFVVACENAINATSTLAEFIRPQLTDDVRAAIDSRVRFANCAVDRIVPQQSVGSGGSGASSGSESGSGPDSPHGSHQQGSLDVRIEQFYEWCVELPPFEGIGHPEIEGIHFVDDLAPYIERKLYTVNTAHATAAYFGHAAGKQLIHETMADPHFRNIVRETIRETSNLIVRKHHKMLTAADQDAYADKIIGRISNPALQDQVARVGRAPLRKLSRNERLVGPASQLADMGEPYDHLLNAIEMAFRFQNVADDDESAELGRIMGDAGMAAEQVVRKVCGLTPADKLFDPVVRVVRKVREGGEAGKAGKAESGKTEASGKDAKAGAAKAGAGSAGPAAGKVQWNMKSPIMAEI